MAVASRRRRGRQLEADQRREGRLGRTARRPAASNRLGDRVGLRQPRRGIGGRRIDPSLDEREHGLEPIERGLLRLALGADERAADHRVAQLFGVRRIEALGELLEAVGVDVDAARERRDGRDEVQAQPAGVPEQPGVRELAHREVQLDLVVGDVEAGAELGGVLGQDRGTTVVEERDADVAARDDLGGELADHLAELHREERPADAPHHAARARDHRAHLFGRLLGHHAGERVGDRRRDRLGELRPDRHGRRDPGAAGEQLGGLRQRREVDRLVEPQGSDLECLVESCPLVGGDLGLRRRRALFALAEGDAPVDAVVGVVHRLLQLGEERGQRGRVVGQPGGAREARGIDSARARKQLAEHLAELVFGVGLAGLVALIGHCRHLHISCSQP